jgi:hypothetical protein
MVNMSSLNEWPEITDYSDGELEEDRLISLSAITQALENEIEWSRDNTLLAPDEDTAAWFIKGLEQAKWLIGEIAKHDSEAKREEDLDNHWLCHCGHYEESGGRCSNCGNEPPWGADDGLEDEFFDNDLDFGFYRDEDFMDFETEDEPDYWLPGDLL